MRSLFLAAAGLAAVGMCTAASAQVTTGPTSLETVGAPTSNDGGITTSFGYQDTTLTSPNFSEYLQINDLDPGSYSIVLGTSSANINFNAFVPGSCTGTICQGTYLTDLAGANFYALLPGVNSGSIESWFLPDTLLAAGSYLFYINGTNANTGSLGGSITITRVADVPEPATWAMMLLGFGAVGYSMRRQRKSVLATA